MLNPPETHDKPRNAWLEALVICPLEKVYDRKCFDCGNEDLNRYLREQARQDANKRVAAPDEAASHHANIARTSGMLHIPSF